MRLRPVGRQTGKPEIRQEDRREGWKADRSASRDIYLEITKQVGDSMVFSSMNFLAYFLPCLLACYFVIPARFREMRNGVLLLFSLVFYACGGPKFLVLMLVSIAVNYIGGLLADENRSRKVRLLGVWSATIIGIGLLGYFKYAGFFAEIINSAGIFVPVPEITLPIGISFYTFQGLSYVIDVYRGDAKVQKNPLKVALYVALFPQLVAGPIVRYTTVEAEISERRESIEEVSAGIVRFIFGLAKKMILANAMGELADIAFSQNTATMSAAFAWLGALAYTAQIYFDFSAYSDMAIGLGRIFGFHFLENFNYPYISKSVTEFWRRWHISLSTWFRDYIYIPLGGSYCSKKRQAFNMFVVWACTGLWHGAAWNFIVWGMWFYLLLVGEKYLWGKYLEKTPAAVQHVYALLAAVISWVFFRAPDLSYAFGYLKAMFSFSGLPADDQAVYYLFQYAPELILCIIASIPVKRAVENALRKKAGMPPLILSETGEIIPADSLQDVCAGDYSAGIFGTNISDDAAVLISADGPVTQTSAFPRVSRGSSAASALLIWGPKLLAVCLLVLSYMELVTGSFNPFIYFRF